MKKNKKKCLKFNLHPHKHKKRTPLRMSFSIVISKPSIFPEALFEVEHFVLDAL